MTHTLKTAALRYAAHGWPVFLLGRTKRPLANCATCRTACRTAAAEHDPQACTCLTCHGFYAATRDPKAIARMVADTPRGMLAIRTGAASGVVVIDIDPEAGGNASLTALVGAGLAPSTRFVRTGSGGLHLYYRHPGPHTKIPCSQGVLGPGVDVRGDGGYVAAPPSVHPRTRQRYVWADQTTQIVEMPPALITACQPARPAPHAPAPAGPRGPVPCARAGGISSPRALLQAHLDAVRRAPEGKRRTTLYGASRGVARMVAAGAITPTDAYTALQEVGLAAGQTNRECRTAIAGGFRDEGVSL